MGKVLLNITTIQAGWKIQLVKEIRRLWGEEKTEPGKRVAFYEQDGKVILEPIEGP
jgi:hypothetical protein